MDGIEYKGRLYIWTDHVAWETERGLVACLSCDSEHWHAAAPDLGDVMPIRVGEFWGENPSPSEWLCSFCASPVLDHVETGATK